jgi:Zn-dependent peptidase ImmA (M78 family)
LKAAESYALAQKIIKKCDGSRDPEVIYQCLGIELEDTFDLANLKGMYSSADRHRTIYLHKRLTGYLRRFVLMHEICHDQIPEHRKRARRMPYKEIQFFGGANQSEREANSVAAHVLIDDEKMVNLIMEGNTAQAIAAELYVPEDLLLIAIEDYHKLHPDFIVRLPRSGRGNYLKDYDIWE